MQEPILRHSYVQINNSLVHLVQYGRGESLVKHPSSSSVSSSLQRFSDSELTIWSNNGISNQSDIANRTASSSITTATTTSNSSRQHNQVPRKLIVFIPGNPGVLGVYHDFLASLFRVQCGSSIKDLNKLPTILAISHNNFDHPDHVQYRTEERICLEDNDLNFVEQALAKNHLHEPHHIEMQILNKLIILKRLLKINLEDCKLVFVGHSIGCYVILRILQDRLLASAHEGSIMIHPALENLALTEKGLSYDRLFGYRLDLLILPIAYFLDKILPWRAKLALTKWFCSPEFVQASSEITIDSVTQLVCRKTLQATIEMAKSEFSSVKSINTEALIKPHVSRLKLIYAINDHWVNTDNRRQLKELYPQLYIEEQSTAHAFVMEPQTVMDYAIKVGILIQDFMDDMDQTL